MSSPSSGPKGDARGAGSPTHLLGSLEDRLGPRRAGDLPWESGDSYILGQLGRATVLVVLSLAVVYLLSPISLLGTGTILRVGSSAGGTVVFGAVCVVVAALLLVVGLILTRSQAWLSRTMILQSNVPAKEMGRLMASEIRALGMKTRADVFAKGHLLIGASYTLRPDYPPLRVVGSQLGYVTWGGARSLLVVPLPLFRHPKWGQEVDALVRRILGWEEPEQVRTPEMPS